MIKATVERKKTMFGKYKGYIAHLGAFEATGDTKEAAESELAQMIAFHRDNCYHREYFHCVDGTVLAFYATIQGWAYDITRPDRTYPCSSTFNPDYSRQSAREAVIRHAESAYGGLVPQGQ